jgi:hypothetical protein
MSRQIKQFPKGKEDWGFFIPIDIEQELTENPITSPVIIISEKEKLKYYLKLHQPNLARSVVIIKNTSDVFSPRALKNNYLKEQANNETNKKTNHQSYLILTTILSSGLFLFFYGHSIFIHFNR